MPPPHASDPASGTAPVLIREMLRQGTERLRPASDSPRLDCELLLAHALGVARASLYARSAEALKPEHIERLDAMLGERARGRPVAQIIGRKEFFSLEFEVTPEVLTPRPETELLVEILAGHLGDIHGSSSCIDLGTGCGAVAVALAHLLPEVRLVATDVSATALEVARRNAARLVPDRIHLTQGSWYEAIDDGRRFDAIAANPPYVESRLCQQGPLRFEPRQALDGGADGLRHLRAVISSAPRYLEPGGMLAVEHGANHGKAVREMMARADLKRPVSHRDLSGHDRISSARMFRQEP